MLIQASNILGMRIRATDGELGKVDDLYFDDHAWTVRYLVVDTGGWLPGRQVLISPESVVSEPGDRKHLPVRLTREQVEMSPGIQQDQPVSRQYERQLAGYYGWQPYWGPVGFAAGPEAPDMVDEPATAGSLEHGSAQVEHRGDPNLRSVREVTGYHILAADGEIGHVEDFLVEDAAWKIRYMEIDTRNWLPGRKVLLAPDWIASIQWMERRVHVSPTRDEIRNGPEYDPDRGVDRQYEQRLHEHYGRRAYWDRD